MINTTDYLDALETAQTYQDLEAILHVIDDAYDRGEMTTKAVTTAARLMRERARQIERRRLGSVLSQPAMA